LKDTLSNKRGSSSDKYYFLLALNWIACYLGALASVICLMTSAWKLNNFLLTNANSKLPLCISNNYQWAAGAITYTSIWLRRPGLLLPYAMMIIYHVVINTVHSGMYYEWAFQTKAIMTYLSKAVFVPDLTFPVLGIIGEGYKTLNKDLQVFLCQYLEGNRNKNGEQLDPARSKRKLIAMQDEWVTLRNYCSEVSRLIGPIWTINIFLMMLNMGSNLQGMLSQSSLDTFCVTDMAASVVTLYVLFRLGQEISGEVFDLHEE
jgi:hypothetical protein